MHQKKKVSPEQRAALQALFIEHLANCGSKGGKSRSKKKMEAIAANLEKARAKRWPKKKAAA